MIDKARTQMKWNAYTKIFLPLLVFSFGMSVRGYANEPNPTIPKGIGTNLRPFLISNIDDLCWIADQVNEKGNSFEGKFFKQTADFNISACENWNGGKGWIPIGSTINPNSTSFKGEYDGNGKIILGCIIKQPNSDLVGLFGSLEGKVHDLAIARSRITGRDHTAILAGTAQHAVIENCYVGGQLSGSRYVGGIVGSAVAVKITKSTAYQVTYGDLNVGGFIGFATAGSQISASRSQASVRGRLFHAGGIVGAMDYNSSVSACYSTGNINGGSQIGGITGVVANNCTIRDSYSTGDVVGLEKGVGGVAGTLLNDVTIERCYATGSVSGNENVGGIVGSLGSSPMKESIRSCYAGNESLSLTSEKNPSGKDFNSFSFGRIYGYFDGWTSSNQGDLGDANFAHSEIHIQLDTEEHSFEEYSYLTGQKTKHGANNEGDSTLTSLLTDRLGWAKSGKQIPNTSAEWEYYHQNLLPVLQFELEEPLPPNDGSIYTPTAPMITLQPLSQRVKPRKTVSFIVKIKESRYDTNYQWYKNDVEIPEETSATLKMSSATELDSGIFHCVVSNEIGTTTSAVATLVVSGSNRIPLYRFKNKNAPGHFFTAEESKKSIILKEQSDLFELEGVSQYVMLEKEYHSFPVFRMYDNATGTSFYTASKTERDKIVAESQGVFSYQDIAFYVFVNPQPGALPVYRFRDTIAGSHFYTISEAEKNVLEGSGDTGLIYDGIAWYTYSKAR